MKVKLHDCVIDTEKISDIRKKKRRLYDYSKRKDFIANYTIEYENMIVVIDKQEYKLLKKIMKIESNKSKGE